MTAYLYVHQIIFLIFLILWKNPHSALLYTHKLISKEPIRHYKQRVLQHLLAHKYFFLA